MSQLKLSRYDQHIELPEVGIEGQKKIYNSRVLVIGAGGLGCPVALYLAGAGVGTIGLIDGDKVEESNLHRQVLYGINDIGHPKVERAAQRLSDMISNQKIKTYAFFLDDKNAEELIADYDLVVDATDNHITRLLINKICLKQNKPWVYGALYRFEGQTAIFNGRNAPCFSCVFPGVNENSALPTCKTSGVLSPVPGVIGGMQALETLKVILGLFDSSHTRLNIMNFLDGTQNNFNVQRNLDCVACGQYN